MLILWNNNILSNKKLKNKIRFFFFAETQRKQINRGQYLVLPVLAMDVAKRISMAFMPNYQTTWTGSGRW